jgi:hypothetical protein
MRAVSAVAELPSRFPPRPGGCRFKREDAYKSFTNTQSVNRE